MSGAASIHPYWLVAGSFAFSLLPVLIGVCTSYLKVSVVLGMLRSGIGAQQVPSTLLVMALSSALSIYIMAPVFNESLEHAKELKLESLQKANFDDLPAKLSPIAMPWLKFMADHTGSREIRSLTQLNAEPKSGDDIPQEILRTEVINHPRILIPAFMLTELKQAFAMGFVLLLPFLVIDLIVANVLAGLGMFMVSPSMISLPLKLLLFVVSDGWILLSRGLILSYVGG